MPRASTAAGLLLLALGVLWFEARPVRAQECNGKPDLDATNDEILKRAILLTLRGLPTSKLPDVEKVNGNPTRSTQPNRNTLAQTMLCEFGRFGMDKLRQALTTPRVNTAVMSMSLDAWGRFRGLQVRQSFVCHATPFASDEDVPDGARIWQNRIRPAMVDIGEPTAEGGDPNRIRVRTVESAFDDEFPHNFGQCIGNFPKERELGVESLGYEFSGSKHEESEIDLTEELRHISQRNTTANALKNGLQKAVADFDGADLRDPTYTVVRWDYQGNTISPLTPERMVKLGLEDVVFEDAAYFDESVSRSMDGVVQFMDIDVGVVARRFAGLGLENSTPSPPRVTSNIEFVLAAAGAVGGAVLEEVLLGQALQRFGDEFEEKVMMSRLGPVVRVGSIMALVVVDLLPLVFVLSNELRVARWRGDVALGSVGVSLYGPEDEKIVRGGGIAVGMVSCLLWLRDARVELAATLLAVAVMMHFCVISISVFRKITRRQAEKKAELERQRQQQMYADGMGLPGVGHPEGAIVMIGPLPKSGAPGPQFDPSDDMDARPGGACAPIQHVASEIGRHIILESPRTSSHIAKYW